MSDTPSGEPMETVIVHAEQNQIEQLGPWVDLVLQVLDHPEAYVTDESILWDLMCLDPEDLIQAQVAELGRTFGFQITSNDKIIDVARRLRDSAQK